MTTHTAVRGQAGGQMNSHVGIQASLQMAGKHPGSHLASLYFVMNCACVNMILHGFTYARVHAHIARCSPRCPTTRDPLNEDARTWCHQPP